MSATLAHGATMVPAIAFGAFDADSIAPALRLAGAAVTAFLVVVFACPFAIRALRRLGARERAEKKDTDLLTARHGTKNDTPTMGGVVIILGLILATAIWAPAGSTATGSGWTTPILCALVLAFGAIGFADDLIKLRHPTRKGLTKRGKMIAMLAVSLVGAFALYRTGGAVGDGAMGALHIPFVGVALAIGPLFVVLASVVVVGAANAVNLTDGLDGLASGLLFVAFGAFALFAIVASDPGRAADTGLVHVADGLSLAVVAASSAGAALGFLVFNRHPARIFMGDTGALALGGGLGTLAVGLRQEVLLVLIGGVFVIEAASVILQVWSFRRTGRRIFKCAPLHHHFEYLDWPERRITRWFWASGAACSALALVGAWWVGAGRGGVV